MTRFAVDTSILVAAAQANDPRGPVARDAIESRLDNGDAMVIAGHSLVETYSALTRLTLALRPTPERAMAAVRSFADEAEIVALPAGGYMD